ncbi:MAG: ABC transporter permease [Rubricella sp.]
MQALDIKLLRDFRRLWVQALAIALVLACGIAVMLMSAGMSRALDDTRAAYYERNGFADLFVQARRVPETLLPEIRALPGVQAAEARVTGLVVLDMDGQIRPAMGFLISRPSAGEPLLNRPLLRSGRWPDPLSSDEVVVNEPFAEANALRPGDRFEATIDGQRRELTLTGTALSPEFIYTIGPGAMMPDNRFYGILWMSDRAISAAFDMEGAFNDLSLALAAGARAEPVMDALDDLLEPYGGLGAYDRSDQISNSFIDAEIEQLRILAYILPPVFLGITVFLLNMVIGRIVALERNQIGLMKAIGYANREIALHYLLLAGLIGMTGVVIGSLGGQWLARQMAIMYADFFDFPYVIFSLGARTYLFAALLGLAAAAFGALRAALSAAGLAPAVAMSPPTPPTFRKGLIDGIIAVFRPSQPTMMILRSVLRAPLRAGFTILGFALAVGILVASSFFPDALEEIMDSVFAQSNRQDATLIFTDARPLSTLEEVANLPGVLAVEGQQYRSAILRNGHLERETAIEARPPGNDLARVVDAEGRAIDAPPGGILLSDRLADALDVEAGDVIEVEFQGDEQETFDLTVSGRVTQYFGLGAYMDSDTLDALFRHAPRVTVANVLIDDAETDALYAAVKDLPTLAGLAMMVENRRSFEDTIEENISIMTGVYLILGVMITVGVAYNGARVQLSERARELASLRILGFSTGEVSYVLVGETMLLALIAQPLGWFIGREIARAMTEGFSSDLYAMPLILSTSTYSYSSLIVLVATLASVLLVRRRLDTLDLVSVMKTRE